MKVRLVAEASTQSRARRPLPQGVVEAMTFDTRGVREFVDFHRGSGEWETRSLLTWVVGQAGLLWGGGPYPMPILAQVVPELDHSDIPGSYGHADEHALAMQLGEIYCGRLSTDDIGVRLGLGGSEVCSMAARIARAATGRDRILSFGYHGNDDTYAHAPALNGVPRGVSGLHWHYAQIGDVLDREVDLREVAAIVVEVPAWDDEAKIRELLHGYRELCDNSGALLVLDDVVLGFRSALGGSCEVYGVRPDFVCLGKAISAVGGVSALVGRLDLMDMLADRVFYSGTFYGHPWLTSIALATVKWLQANREDVYGTRFSFPGVTEYRLGHLRSIGQALKDGLNAIFEEKGMAARVVGQPERSSLVFDEGEPARRAWCSQMIERGVIVDRPQFPTLAHTPGDVEETLAAARSIG